MMSRGSNESSTTTKNNATVVVVDDSDYDQSTITTTQQEQEQQQRINSSAQRRQTSEHISWMILMIIMVLLLALFFVYGISSLLVDSDDEKSISPSSHNNNVISPNHYYHWLIMLGSATLTQTLERFATTVFQPFFRKNSKDPIDYHSQKSAKYCCRLIYHLCISLYGHFVLQDILPCQLLGSKKSIDEAFEISMKGRPYQKPSSDIVLYAFVAMGYHVGDEIDHAFLKERKSDYWEMLSHHTITLMLFAGMIAGNHLPLGCMIAYLHNLADIWGSSIKCCASTQYNTLSVVIFLVMMFVWGWTRLIVFPQIIYKIVCLDDYKGISSLYYIVSTLFLCVLQVMHVYWYYLFVRMLFKFSKDGSTDDIQSQQASNQNQKNGITAKTKTK